MNEAEILELKLGTPRLPARKGLSLWEGGIAPRPRGHAWVGRTQTAGLSVMCPLLFSANPPGLSVPGPESLIVIIN